MDGVVKRKCGDCIFVAKGDGRKYKFYCHRYPPQVLNEAPVFPAVSETQWCGEFKDKWQIRTERVDP